MYNLGGGKPLHGPYDHRNNLVSGDVNYPPANYTQTPHRLSDYIPIHDDYDRHFESHVPSHQYYESSVYPDNFSEERKSGHKSHLLPSGHGSRPAPWTEPRHGGGVLGQSETQVNISQVEERVHGGKPGTEARVGSGGYEDVDEVTTEFIRKEHELFRRDELLSMQDRP